MSLFPGLFDHSLQRNSLEKPMFRKTAICGHFGRIRPFPVTEPGRNCQKAHLQAKTFHMSLFPGLYDHSLQSYSLEKNRWRTDRRTDGQTDGHPESIAPQPLGLGPNYRGRILAYATPCFCKGPKCLLQGAEVYFARGRSVFSRGAEVSWRGAEVSFPKRAEVSNRGRSGRGRSGRGRSVQNSCKIMLFMPKITALNLFLSIFWLETNRFFCLILNRASRAVRVFIYIGEMYIIVIF